MQVVQQVVHKLYKLYTFLCKVVYAKAIVGMWQCDVTIHTPWRPRTYTMVGGLPGRCSNILRLPLEVESFVRLHTLTTVQTSFVTTGRGTLRSFKSLCKVPVLPCNGSRVLNLPFAEAKGRFCTHLGLVARCLPYKF